MGGRLRRGEGWSDRRVTGGQCQVASLHLAPALTYSLPRPHLRRPGEERQEGRPGSAPQLRRLQRLQAWGRHAAVLQQHWGHKASLQEKPGKHKDLLQLGRDKSLLRVKWGQCGAQLQVDCRRHQCTLQCNPWELQCGHNHRRQDWLRLQRRFYRLQYTELGLQGMYRQLQGGQEGLRLQRKCLGSSHQSVAGRQRQSSPSSCTSCSCCLATMRARSVTDPSSPSAFTIASPVKRKRTCCSWTWCLLLLLLSFCLMLALGLLYLCQTTAVMEPGLTEY